MIYQKEIQLPAFKKGFHLITSIILKNCGNLPHSGLLNIFIKHTSAAITINENADPTVREDFNTFMDSIVPEDKPYYLHTSEGSDDMPAHIKSSFMGSSITIPVTNKELNLGVWQGIYLCEFRTDYHQRVLIITIFS